MGRLENKIAIITGGGRGIGKAITNRYLNEGATVILAELDEQSGKNTSDSMGCHFVKTDISHEDLSLIHI